MLVVVVVAVVVVVVVVGRGGGGGVGRAGERGTIKKRLEVRIDYCDTRGPTYVLTIAYL